MADTSAIWQQAVHTNYHLLAAQQEPYKNAHISTEINAEFNDENSNVL